MAAAAYGQLGAGRARVVDDRDHVHHPWIRATAAGRRSNTPFHTRRASL